MDHKNIIMIDPEVLWSSWGHLVFSHAEKDSVKTERNCAAREREGPQDTAQGARWGGDHQVASAPDVSW